MWAHVHVRGWRYHASRQYLQTEVSTDPHSTILESGCIRTDIPSLATHGHWTLLPILVHLNHYALHHPFILKTVCLLLPRSIYLSNGKFSDQNIIITYVFRDKHAEQPANRTTCTDCTVSSGHSICKSVLSAFFLSQSSFHEQEKYINRTLSFYCFASAGKLSQIPHCSARPRLVGESKLLSPQQYTPVLLHVLYSRFHKS